MSDESLFQDVVSGDSSVAASATSQEYGSVSTYRGSVGSFADFGNANHALRAEVRREQLQKYADEPNGFDYDENTCYRNAVLIMLMTSEVFRKYVKWHIQQLDELGSFRNDNLRYSDLVVELRRLSEVFWGRDGTDRQEEATGVFWRCVISKKNPRRWPRHGPRDKQQGAQEFLSWISENLRLQAQAQDELVEVVPEFDEIIQVRHVQRYTCTSCDAQKSFKHRSPNSELNDFLMLNLDNGRNKSTSDTAQQATAAIDQLLVSLNKELVNERRCAECETQWKDHKRTTTIQEALDVAIAQNHDKRGGQWTHLQRLTEVIST